MMNPSTSPGASPPALPPAVPSEGQPGPLANAPAAVGVERLPFAVKALLSWLPESEWHLVQAVICHGSFIREIIDVAKFVDAIWTNSKKAEDRLTNRVTGAERDAFREGLEQDIKDIVTRAVELARRARLTEILQRNRGLVLRYVPEISAKTQPRGPRKSENDKKADAPKESARSSEPSLGPAPHAPALQSGPDFINRWLAGIRRIRQSDPSFARASEVTSMFEKALDIAGPRKAEVEHMLAQYKEAMHHARESADPGLIEAPLVSPAPATDAA
jgi:hypothetical protein